MRDRTPIQSAALLVGLVFLLVGILGFIPGITSNYDEMSFAGSGSDAELLGIFQVSILHNIVHLLFGIAGIALARTWDGARTFLIGGGVIYLLLWLDGILGAMDWLPADDTDDWLHLALALGMLALWATMRGRRAEGVAAASETRAANGRRT